MKKRWDKAEALLRLGQERVALKAYSMRQRQVHQSSFRGSHRNKHFCSGATSRGLFIADPRKRMNFAVLMKKEMDYD